MKKLNSNKMTRPELNQYISSLYLFKTCFFIYYILF